MILMIGILMFALVVLGFITAIRQDWKTMPFLPIAAVASIISGGVIIFGAAQQDTLRSKETRRGEFIRISPPKADPCDAPPVGFTTSQQGNNVILCPDGSVWADTGNQ